MVNAFQENIGGRFAPLTMLVYEDAELDSIVSEFNKVVTDTATELLGKRRQKKSPGLLTKSLIVVTKEKKEVSLKGPKMIERSTKRSGKT